MHKQSSASISNRLSQVSGAEKCYVMVEYRAVMGHLNQHFHRVHSSRHKDEFSKRIALWGSYPWKWETK